MRRRFLALVLIFLSAVGVTAQVPSGESFFVTAEVVPSEGLVGQQMNYVVTAYSDTLRDVTLTPPAFAGMVQGDIRSVGSSVTLEGKQYNLVTFAVTVYPSLDGVLTIPSAEIAFEGTVLTGTETRQTEAVTFRAMMPADAPEDFSGLVGRHDSRFSVEVSAAELGQPITAEYSIRGTGYVGGLPAPELILPDGWRAYLDPAQVTTISDGTVTTSEKTFRWRVMPDRAGALSLGVAPLTVYDLPTAAFVTLTSESIPIQVLPGSNGETVRASAQAALENSGLGLPAATQTNISPPFEAIWWFIPLSAAVFLLAQAILNRIFAARVEAYRKNALTAAKIRLEGAAKKSGESALKAIEQTVEWYLNDKQIAETTGIRGALILVESARYAPSEFDTVRELASAVYMALSQADGEVES